MSFVVSQPPASGVQHPTSSGIWRRVLAALPSVFFAVLWLDLIRQLSFTWSTREQYSYGWFVPFFAFVLLWRRWHDRPSLSASTPDFSPLRLDRGEGQGEVSRWLSLLFPLCVFLFALLLLPLRVICEINPDWPLITWTYGVITVTLTLYAFYLAGGWPWVRHFAFPVAFILVAIAWPHRIEKGLTQGLMQWVASITVEVAGWFNIPAMQRGNLIEIGAGVVGIDEACSGVRSFQSSLMAALLMGELYRLRLWARLGLVGCGVCLAIGFNIVRTCLLVWQCSREGMSAIDKWHDSAGLTILVACFFSLWALAGWMTKRWGTKSEIRSQNSEVSASFLSASTPLAHALGEGSRVRERESGERAGVRCSAASSPREMATPPISPRPISTSCCQPSAFARTYLFALGTWLLAILVATQAWYHFRSLSHDDGSRWSVVLPTHASGFKEIELPPRSVQLLRHDAGATGVWTENDGSEWSLYFFRWNPTGITSIFRARQHRPDVCLPASGLRLVEDAGFEQFSVHGLTLPFRKYTYESAGKSLHVFFCQWEDGAKRQSGVAESEQGGRVKAAWDGRRNMGQQSLELILSGYNTPAEAGEALRARLPGLIKLQPVHH